MNYERLAEDVGSHEDDSVQFVEVVAQGPDGTERVSTDYKDETLRALGAFPLSEVMKGVK